MKCSQRLSRHVGQKDRVSIRRWDKKLNHTWLWKDFCSTRSSFSGRIFFKYFIPRLKTGAGLTKYPDPWPIVFMDLIFPAIPKERIVFKEIRVSIGIREEKVARIIPFFLGKSTRIRILFLALSVSLCESSAEDFLLSSLPMALDRCG